MTKKTIILVLIAVILLNTIYWINKSITHVYGREGKIMKLKDAEITLLLITDAVLITISFMIILLYKKE